MWSLPLWNAVEEPPWLGCFTGTNSWHIGDREPNRTNTGGIFVCKRRGKRSSSLDPDRLQCPCGKQQVGDPPPALVASSSTCKSEQGARGGLSQHRAGVKTGQPPGQLSEPGVSCGLLSPALFSYISLKEVQKQQNKSPVTFQEVFLLTMRSAWALESDQGPNLDPPCVMQRSAWGSDGGALAPSLTALSSHSKTK